MPQEEVLDSSPSFSPLSGSVLSVEPSSGVSGDGVDSGDDTLASLVDSRPVRSKIPVKVGRSGSGGGGVASPSCVKGGDCEFGSEAKGNSSVIHR